MVYSMGNKIALGYLILSAVIGLIQVNVGIVRRRSVDIERGLWLALFWPLWILTWPGRRIRRRDIRIERAERERVRVLSSSVEQLVEE